MGESFSFDCVRPRHTHCLHDLVVHQPVQPLPPKSAFLRITPQGHFTPSTHAFITQDSIVNNACADLHHRQGR